MKLLIIGNNFQPTKEIEFDNRWLWLACGLFFLIILSLGITIGLAFVQGSKLSLLNQKITDMTADILYEQHQLNSYMTYNDAFLTEQSKQAGLLEAKITRIESYSQKIAEGAGFSSEFDFSEPPALGGPDEQIKMTEAHSAMTVESFHAMFKRLEATLAYREKEIDALSSLLQDTGLSKERTLTGRPIEQGWLSSRYGHRRDPFHGRQTFHRGVDFAGKSGSNILSVASGVVIYSGDRYGYGEMVEIDHANGFVTRYAHNSENKVKVGDVVNKGQVIAKMGSSGRSTGPHVHFEVLKNGRQVDPSRYIYRKAI